MPKRNKEAERKAKRAAREARKKMLTEDIAENAISIPDDEFKEKRKAVKKAIEDGFITSELNKRFSSSPLPLFLEPLQDQVGYRVTYIHQQDVVMPSDEELMRLRIYNGVPDKTQLTEMLGWNIRKAVLQQQEHGQYEEEVKKHIIMQLMLQAEFDEGIQIKNDRITVTKGRQVFKTDQKISDIDIGNIFYMKAEGIDPFGGPNWKPQFESREIVVKEIEEKVRYLAQNAKAQSGQNKAFPEIMKIRSIVEDWLLLFGKQIPMMERPQCYIKPYESAEYAEDYFIELKYENNKITIIRNELSDEMESEKFFEHIDIVKKLLNDMPQKPIYCGGQGIMKGYTNIQIGNTSYLMELMPHTVDGWEEKIIVEFEKLKEIYENTKLKNWKQLAKDYPLVYDDAISIRIAKTVYNGIKIQDLQKKCKFIDGKEFARRINLLVESGVLNTFNGKGFQKFYWGPNYEICTQPPIIDDECDAKSFVIFAEAKAIRDPVQRRTTMLKCTGGFLLAFMDELKKEFLYAPKPVKELMKMKIHTDTDKKRVAAMKQLI